MPKTTTYSVILRIFPIFSGLKYGEKSEKIKNLTKILKNFQKTEEKIKKISKNIQKNFKKS